MPNVKVTYDPSSNTAYVYLDENAPRNVGEYRVCEEMGNPVETILDIDPSGRVVGIELLNANRRLPERLLSEDSAHAAR